MNIIVSVVLWLQFPDLELSSETPPFAYPGSGLKSNVLTLHPSLWFLQVN